jgi:hypothetical protein
LSPNYTGILNEISEAQKKFSSLKLAFLGHSAQGLDLLCLGGKFVGIFNNIRMLLW